MAIYEHLPIYRAAFDLAAHIERIVRNFSRYHKYSPGTELRDCSRRVLERIIEANNSRPREPILLELRSRFEWFKVLARLCHESGAFADTRAYLHVSEQVVGLPNRMKAGFGRPPGRRAVMRAGGGQGRRSMAGTRTASEALPGEPVSSSCVRPAPQC